MKRFIVFPLLFICFSVFALPTERDLFREAENRFLSEDYVLAIKLYDDLADRFPLSEYLPDAMFRKAVALYKTGNPGDAFDLLLQIEQRYRSTRYLSLIPFWKGIIRFEDENYQDASDFFSVYLRTGTLVLKEETLLYLGRAQEKLGRVEEALGYLSDLLTLKTPVSEQYGFTLFCSLLVKTERYEELLDRTEGVDIDSFRPEWKQRVVLYRAEALWNVDRIDEAVEVYRTLLDTVPEVSSVAFQRLFSYYRRTGNEEELQGVLMQAERVLAGRIDILTSFWLRIAAEHYKDEKYEPAKLYLQRIWNAGNRGSVDPLVPLYLSQIFALQGDVNRGTAVLEEFLTSGGAGDEYILFQLSGLYLRRERWPETAEVCEDFLRSFPDSPWVGEVSYRYSFSLYRQGKLEASRRVIRGVFTGGKVGAGREKMLKLSAVIERRLGADEKSLELLEEYIALNPSDIDAAVQIAELSFEKRDFDTVIERAEDLTGEEGKTGILARYLVGLSLVTRRDYQEAFSLLSRITAEEATAAGIPAIIPYTLFYRGWILYRLAEYDRAVKEFESLTGTYPTFTLSPEALYLAGWCAFAMENFPRAQVFFRTYASRVGEQGKDRGLFMYAKSYDAAGKSREAELVLQQIYSERPASAFADDAMFEHAGILERDEKFQEAMDLYRDLHERYPGSDFGEESLFRRAELLYRLGKWHDARDAYFNLRAAYPDGSLFDAALYWGGMASVKAGGTFGAVLLWEKLIREKPDSSFRPDALEKTAQVYRDAGDYSKAFALYNELIAMYPAEAKAVSADRAAEELMYLIQGSDDLEADLQVTIDRSGGASSPEGREAMIELARLYLYRGGSDREKALELIDRVIARKGQDIERAARAQYYRAEYFFRKNDLTQAWKEFLSAATMNPADKDLMAMSLFRAVQVAVTAGKLDEARDLVVKLEDYFPESSWAAEGRKILEGQQ